LHADERHRAVAAAGRSVPLVVLDRGFLARLDVGLLLERLFDRGTGVLGEWAIDARVLGADLGRAPRSLVDELVAEVGQPNALFEQLQTLLERGVLLADLNEDLIEPNAGRFERIPLI
jgi:hypothetical protein